MPVVAAGTPEIAHCIRDGIARATRHVAASHSWSEAARTVVELVRPNDPEAPANGFTPNFDGENRFARAEPSEPEVKTGPATHVESLPAG